MQRPKTEAMYAAIPDVPHPKTDFDFVLRASAKSFERFAASPQSRLPAILDGHNTPFTLRMRK